MGFTFNDFMHQVVSPIEKGITSPFTQASSDLKKTSSSITHSFDNVVDKGAGALDGLFNSLSNPLLLIGVGVVAFFVITKK
jgi:hypothetical protein